MSNVQRDFWGAHAWSVLAKAFCLRELSLKRPFALKRRLGKSSFSQNAKTSTPQACAPQKHLRLLALVMFALSVPAQGETPLAHATVVVYNSAFPESLALAKFYAEKRGIPRDHLVGLACSTEEEISREDYDRTIRDPLRKVFFERKWWTKRAADETRIAISAIRFVAMIKGMPLKVRAAVNYPGDKPEAGPIGNRNEASVDAELAVLAHFSPQISGVTLNPYFQSYRRILEWNEIALLLVCRLDGPSAEIVRRMITDAIETEKTGLWGRAYVDGAHYTSGGYVMGETWLAETVEQFHRAGVPVVYDDSPQLFPEAYPMSDCALYYGWYTGEAAGPFAQTSFHFLRGAIAAHIYSFSADSLRVPSHWCAALLSRGAAATVGNVYEPYLQLTTHLEILNDRLLHGFTFAESSYMGTPGLSWMTVMVGDPLYRPYANWLEIEANAEPQKASEWEMSHEFAQRNGSLSPADYRKAAREAASRTKNGAMIEDLGGAEMREGNFAAAADYFRQARSIYTKRDDILRVVLQEVDCLSKADEKSRALDLVHNTLKAISDAPSMALLRKIEQDLNQPAAPAQK